MYVEQLFIAFTPLIIIVDVTANTVQNYSIAIATTCTTMINVCVNRRASVKYVPVEGSTIHSFALKTDRNRRVAISYRWFVPREKDAIFYLILALSLQKWTV